MPSNQLSRTVIQVGPDAYVTLEGEVLRSPPLGARVLSESISPVQFGADAGGGGIVPMSGGADAPSLWDDIARGLHFSEAMKVGIEHALELVGGISSVVGAVVAIKDIIELSGIFGAKVTLEDVLRAVQGNYVATMGAAHLDHLRSIADHSAVASGAGAAVKTFTDIPGTRPTLVTWEQPLSTACLALTDRAYQRALLNMSEYMGSKWIFEEAWLDVPDFVTASLPAGTEPVLRLFDIPGSSERFDYRFVLGAAVFAISVRVSMMRALEPEFRSTGRYRHELQQLCSRLRQLLHQWSQCIQWSWLPADDDNIAPGGVTFGLHGMVYDNFVPVGAADICTGYAVWTSSYEPVWNPDAPWEEPEHWRRNIAAGPDIGPIHHWPWEVKQTYWARAHAGRMAARQKVMVDSGYMAFAAFITSLCALSGDPDVSETIVISGRSSPRDILRPPMRRVGREAVTAGGIFCEARGFVAERWQARATLSLDIRTQTPDSRSTFVIPYRYALVTPGGRQHLVPGQGNRVTINAMHFLAERGPAGETRDVSTTVSNVQVTYSLTEHVGHTTLDLAIPATAGNVVLTLVVEEPIQSGRVLETFHEMVLVTQEFRLPSEYFQHLRACQDKANKTLGEVNKKYAISAEPGQRFDPRRQHPEEFLERVRREDPETFQAALFAVNRQMLADSADTSVLG